MRAAAVVLACAAPAAAHADEREQCSVTYVTVPDGAKDIIDGWIAAEPHCRGTFALRVIPTHEGFFLFAERPDGTVHERQVPDLAAAGVLVASWVSDSWQLPSPRPPRPRLEVRAVVIDERAGGVTAAAPSRPDAARWIALGGTRVTNAPGVDPGFRIEADLVTRGPWKLGVAVQKVEDRMLAVTSDGIAQGQIDDWSAGVVASRTVRWRQWELRGALGMFVLGSELHEEAFGGPSAPGGFVHSYDIGVSPAVEVSATIARDLGDRWGVGVTVGATLISQEWHAPDASAQQMAITRDETQPIGVVSVRRKI